MRSTNRYNKKKLQSTLSLSLLYWKRWKLHVKYLTLWPTLWMMQSAHFFPSTRCVCHSSGIQRICRVGFHFNEQY
jgi:hypothetical protein